MFFKKNVYYCFAFYHYPTVWLERGLQCEMQEPLQRTGASLFLYKSFYSHMQFQVSSRIDFWRMSFI